MASRPETTTKGIRMPRKKTIAVAELLATANRALTDMAETQNEIMPLPEARAFRRAIATMIEDTLHKTGNYKGFRYTDPSAKYSATGIIEGSYDDTRRAYYGA